MIPLCHEQLNGSACVRLGGVVVYPKYKSVKAARQRERELTQCRLDLLKRLRFDDDDGCDDELCLVFFIIVATHRKRYTKSGEYGSVRRLFLKK